MLSWLAAMASGMSAAGFSRQAAPLERELLAAAARGGAWDTRARIVDGVASSLSGGAGAPLDDARFDALVAALRAMMGATAKAEKEKWAFFSAQCELIAGAIDRERDAARRGRLVRAAFLGADSILGALEAKTRAQADGRTYVSSSSSRGREASVRLNVQLIVTVFRTDAWPDPEDAARIYDRLGLAVRLEELLKTLRDDSGAVRMCAARHLPRLYALFLDCSPTVQLSPKLLDAACERLCVRHGGERPEGGDAPFEE